MSDRDSWETPQLLFNWLYKKYRFNADSSCFDLDRSRVNPTEVLAYRPDGSPVFAEIDRCWDCRSSICKNSSWNLHPCIDKGIIFCNPPYSKIQPWLDKAVEELDKDNCKVAAFVLPQDLSTKWGKFCVNHASKIIFITGGRVQFIAPEGVKSSSNTKGTMVVQFDSSGSSLVTEYVDIKEIIG